MPEKVRSIKKSPELIIRAGLGDGDWMHFSKLTARALIRPEIFELKVNVLGVLMLHAFGFGTELGVIMRRLKKYEDVDNSPGIVKVFSAEKPGHRSLITEVMTSQSIATLLYKYGMEAYEEAGIKPSPAQIAALKQSRQNVRRVLETLEGDGLVERARLDCQPQHLVALGYEEAVKRELLTPLSQLSDRQRKQLGTGRTIKVGTFLLAKPKPAKTFGQRSSVVTRDYTEPNPLDINAISTEQLFFAWGTEFGIDPEVFKRHPELQRETDRYVVMAQRAQRDEDARKRQELKLRGMAELIAREAGNETFSGTQTPLNFKKPQAPSNPTGQETGTTIQPPAGGGAETPLVSQPRKKAAADFNEALCVRFRAVGANLPTQKQTDAILAQLGDQAEMFLSWLSANEMHRRRPRHGGVLPLFLEEFQKLRASLEAEQAVRREPSREENLAYLRREWPGMSDSERQEYLAAFPELAEQRSASGD